MKARLHRLLPVALFVIGGPSHGQTLQYVEPGLASCPPLPAASKLKPTPVARGRAVPGRLVVRCGFRDGSYTITLVSSDPAATLSPRSFLVNFGKLASTGAFSVTFATDGLQQVSATVHPNMGSPPAPGRFEGTDNRFKVE